MNGKSSKYYLQDLTIWLENNKVFLNSLRKVIFIFALVYVNHITGSIPPAVVHGKPMESYVPLSSCLLISRIQCLLCCYLRYDTATFLEYKIKRAFPKFHDPNCNTQSHHHRRLMLEQITKKNEPASLSSGSASASTVSSASNPSSATNASSAANASSTTNASSGSKSSSVAKSSRAPEPASVKT